MWNTGKTRPIPLLLLIYCTVSGCVAWQNLDMEQLRASVFQDSSKALPAYWSALSQKADNAFASGKTPTRDSVPTNSIWRAKPGTDSKYDHEPGIGDGFRALPPITLPRGDYNEVPPVTGRRGSLRDFSQEVKMPKYDKRCLRENDMIADMMNCAGYFICINSQISRDHLCTSPLLYSSETKTCRYPNRVNCGKRPLPQQNNAVHYSATNVCYFAEINITIHVFNTATPRIKFPSKTVVVPRQSLYFILLMIMGEDPFLRFHIEPFQNQGLFVTSINDVHKTPNGVWIAVDKRQMAIKKGVDRYVPDDGDIISFIYYDPTQGS